jgi:hypothetical protein
MTGPIDDRAPATEAGAEGRHREDRAPATPTTVTPVRPTSGDGPAGATAWVRVDRITIEPAPSSPEGERIRTRILELRHHAGRVMDAPVLGPRDELTTVAGAKERAEQLDNQIRMDEVRGSRRHHRVSRGIKLTALLLLAVVDFPIMLWLASSVFNVDWGDPVGLPLVISAVVSLLVTGGAAAALHHLGHNLREAKNDRRQLPWSNLSTGSRLSLVAVALLVVTIACVMFVRVWTEGAESGLSDLAVLLAVLAALVMMISAALVFWAAVRDGSPEQDDLRFWSRIVAAHLEEKRRYENAAVELAHRYEFAQQQAARPAEQSSTTR